MGCEVGKLDLCVRKGDTAQEITLEIYTSDDNGNFQSVPDDLSGYLFQMDIVSEKKRVIKSLTLSSGLSLNDNKLVVLKMPEVDIEEGKYTYAIKMKQPNTDIETFLRGNYTVQEELVTTPTE